MGSHSQRIQKKLIRSESCLSLSHGFPYPSFGFPWGPNLSQAQSKPRVTKSKYSGRCIVSFPWPSVVPNTRAFPYVLTQMQGCRSDSLFGVIASANGVQCSHTFFISYNSSGSSCHLIDHPFITGCSAFTVTTSNGLFA